MQSSTAVAFRGLVMLGCLVAIPLAALLGSSLPELLGSLAEGRLAICATSEGSTAEAEPEFEPMPAAPAATLCPAPGGTAGLSSSVFRAGPPGTVGWCSSAALAGGLPPAKSEVPVATASRFREIRDRLSELGATYYLLETWGDRRELYRFYCRMAIGRSPDLVRCFEAVDADPLRAMTEVLGQVERWRAEGR